MPTNTVMPPYPPFTGADGLPLDGGFIYIGVAGFEARSTPKAAFFDAALTISTGPYVLTSAGYPVRNGSAATIYVDGNHSMTVTDRNGVVLFSTLSRTFELGTATTALSQIVAPDGNLVQTGFGFATDTNTGLIRTGADTMQGIAGGAAVWQAAPAEFRVMQPAVFAQGGAGYVFSATQATTSGTAFDFTGIPAWATEILVEMWAVSLSGSDHLAVQVIVAGSVVSSGYFTSTSIITGTAVTSVNGTSTMVIGVGNTLNNWNGNVWLNSLGNGRWTFSHAGGMPATNATSFGGGRHELAGAIDGIRVTRGGTNTFTGGQVRVGYR